MNLRDLRISLGITQQRASEVSGVPFRTYLRYEKNESYGSALKRGAIVYTLREKCETSETRGLLTLDEIKKTVTAVLSKYGDKVTLCYLFGSYAKGYAKENSDVDLCVSTSLTGFDYLGLSEELRVSLRKRVDLLRLSDMASNLELLNEIMKDGIKIYG